MAKLDDYDTVTQYIRLDPKLTNLLSEYYTYLAPVVIQLTCLLLLATLAIFEVKVKFEAKALEILLHKNRSSTRQVMVYNCGQIVIYIAAVYWRLCSPELQAIAAYSLAAKLIQTNWQQFKVKFFYFPVSHKLKCAYIFFLIQDSRLSLK